MLILSCQPACRMLSQELMAGRGNHFPIRCFLEKDDSEALAKELKRRQENRVKQDEKEASKKNEKVKDEERAFSIRGCFLMSFLVYKQ